ncbi:hypothetical protein DAEQUDRAFT_755094 [Daedalea quercina L-15889]|uniref:MARVEL domain-containing protein n=1 Tax=Daedalea quercina L-15889 TaxID=1314783 RepID=A0A165SYZ9_9APHY|nr:hypothetical protein DAEQUDRAFT_755094 [Daedalea quercina L-15889]
MFWLGIFRLTTLIWAAVCGIIVLALGAHMISETQQLFSEYTDYSALGVAVGVLTFVSAPTMIALDFFMSTFTSWISVELGWLSLLWILFLAAGADAANGLNNIDNQCDFVLNEVNNICHETQAMTAFAFLAWIALMAYTITLLVVAILNGDASTNVWTSSVRDTFGGASAKSGNQYPMTTNAATAPVVYSQPRPATETV